MKSTVQFHSENIKSWLLVMQKKINWPLKIQKEQLVYWKSSLSFTALIQLCIMHSEARTTVFICVYVCGCVVFLGVVFGLQWPFWCQSIEYFRGTRDIGLGRVRHITLWILYIYIYIYIYMYVCMSVLMIRIKICPDICYFQQTQWNFHW